MPKKHTLLFFTLIIVSFTLMTYQSKKGHLFTNNIIYSFFNHSGSIIKSFADSVKSPFKIMALLEEENKKLKKQIDRLLLEKESYQEALLENRRLRELLKLSENRKDFFTSARVISRGIDHLAKSLILDKGQDEGITKDMVAITPKGLAGKIFNVSGSFSNLLLITNINFSASVRIKDSRKEGILSGTGTRKCILKYIPHEEEINPGDIVLTSGLDSLFPPGIPVGYVSRVDRKGPGEHFQYIEVIPFQDDTKIEELIILR